MDEKKTLIVAAPGIMYDPEAKTYHLTDTKGRAYLKAYTSLEACQEARKDEDNRQYWKKDTQQFWRAKATEAWYNYQSALLAARYNNSDENP